MRTDALELGRWRKQTHVVVHLPPSTKSVPFLAQQGHPVFSLVKMGKNKHGDTYQETMRRFDKSVLKSQLLPLQPKLRDGEP